MDAIDSIFYFDYLEEKYKKLKIKMSFAQSRMNGIDSETFEVLKLYHSVIDPYSSYIHWSDFFVLYRLRNINIDLVDLIDIMIEIRNKYSDNSINKDEKIKQIERKEAERVSVLKNKFSN